MDACSIMIGLVSVGASDTDALCVRACKDEDNHNYIIRCLSRSTGRVDSASTCGVWFDDNEFYKENADDCTVTGDTVTDSCHAFYQITCIQNY